MKKKKKEEKTKIVIPALLQIKANHLFYNIASYRRYT